MILLESVSQYIIDNKLGEFISLASLVVSVLGLIITAIAAAAAVGARRAAKEAKQAIRQLDVVVDLSSILAMMEEIKLHHRTGQWEALLFRYSIVRSKLIGINNGSFNFSESHRTAITDAVEHLSKMETTIEKVRVGKVTAPTAEALNRPVGNLIDSLGAVLSELKSKIEEK